MEVSSHTPPLHLNPHTPFIRIYMRSSIYNIMSSFKFCPSTKTELFLAATDYLDTLKEEIFR